MINDEYNYGNVRTIGTASDKGQSFKPTTGNFAKILCTDPEFAYIRFNELSNQVEDLNDKGIYVRWTDTDDARARAYIETKYGIYNIKKFDDVFRVYSAKKRYNPSTGDGSVCGQ